MKTFINLTRLVCFVAFVLLAAVSSLPAQTTDTKPTAEVSVKPDEPKASTVTPNEKIKFSPSFDSLKEKTASPPDFEPPVKDFRFVPKTFFFPKKDEVDSKSEKTDSQSAPLPRNANVNFPRNQTASPPAKQTSPVPYVREAKKERFKDYVRNVVGPYSLLGTAVFAGIFQYRDLPPEWENDSKGYARRFASALGILAINETTVYALDEAFKLDSDYYKSTKKTFKGRLQDAVVNTLMARKPDGRRVFGFPRIAGNYSSAIIADTTWYPKRFGVKDGIVDGTYSIGVDVLFNIAREFLFKGK